MSDILNLKITSEGITISLTEFTSFTLKAQENSRSLPCDVLVSAFGQKKLLKEFAELMLHFMQSVELPVLAPEITCVTGSNQSEFAFLIGVYKVVYIDFGSNQIAEILDLYRKKSDDHGFYNMEVSLRPDGFLLIYESGVARISNDGRVVWHTRLQWDDIYTGRDKDNLYYSSEYGEFDSSTWAISIIDGHVFQLSAEAS